MEYFKQRLKERLATIMASQDARIEESPLGLDQIRVGLLSRIDAMQQQAMVQAAAHLSLAEGQRIEAAPRRLESGGYGFAWFATRKSVQADYVSTPSVLTSISCARQVEAR